MMPSPPIALRVATPDDAPALRLLHRASLWGLGVFDYGLAEIESIARHVQTLDPALIASGRYYVALADGEIAGSGGWSDDAHLHPILGAANSNDAGAPLRSAKLRAIFVSPKFARRGVGGALMARAESDALSAGFAAAEVLATLTGVRLCERIGYASVRRVRLPLADGTQLDFVHMRKLLSGRVGKRAA